MEYYHACPIMLAPGSIILPGNWGRIEFLTGNESYLYQKECFFEETRAKLFPQKPSRLVSCFVCPDIISVKTFIAQHSQFSLCYRVEFIYATENMHRVPFDLCPIPEGEITRAWAEPASKKYWSWQEGQGGEPFIEVFAQSPIRIISPGMTLEQINNALP